MTHSKVDAFDHATDTAYTWVADVTRELGSEDRRLAYRILRAWLHTLRDRLTVDSAAVFAAQLPAMLRGVFYDGWQPARVPVKYGPDEYLERFAEEALIPVADVPRSAETVTRVVARHLSPGHVSQAMAQLPRGLRSLLSESSGESLVPDQPTGGSTSGTRTGPTTSGPEETAAATAPADATTAARLERLETQVASLVDALTVLARSLEEVPGQEPDDQRRARAARLAHEMLLAPGR
ncbi:MAG: DUF2267 domain-containing protein [Nocardioidaceae bacterium]